MIKEDEDIKKINDYINKSNLRRNNFYKKNPTEQIIL